MAKKLLHRCIGAHARVHLHFLRRVSLYFDTCCEHHACAGVQVLCASAHIFAYTLATECAYVFMYVQFVHSASGNKGGCFELSSVHQRAYLRTRSLQSVHMCLCMCSLSIQRRGTRAGVSANICDH